MMRSLTPFLGMRPATVEEANETAEIIPHMKTPTTAKWLNARIATLLAHYYVANADTRLMEAIADDWYRALKDYPAWAISNACRSWLSAENEKRRMKPLPGDIQELAEKQMERIRVAERALLRGVPEPEMIVEVRHIPTVEERKEIVKDVLAKVWGNA